MHTISPALQRHYKSEALNLAIQDGPAAGQSVPHIHVHILPRKPGDFGRNDDVYDELEKSNMNRKLKVDADEDRKPRTLSEMAAEASELRTLFSDSLPIPS